MNTFITPAWVGPEVRVASNSLKFVGAITKQLSDDYNVSGTRVGATVSVRRPQRFQTTTGAIGTRTSDRGSP